MKRTATELKRRRAIRRAAWCQKALGDRTSWHFDPDPIYYGGGRTCAACGRLVHNAYRLTRADGATAGVIIYLGETCVRSAFAWLTGGLTEK
jgi:hypothetical protein